MKNHKNISPEEAGNGTTLDEMFPGLDFLILPEILFSPDPNPLTLIEQEADKLAMDGYI